MIIKIRTRSRNLEYEYVMFDGIRRISKYPNFVLNDALIQKLTDDYVFLAYASNQGTYERECCRIKCHTVDGNEFTIVFDTIAFVMSDTGKTIEKVSTVVK